VVFIQPMGHLRETTASSIVWSSTPRPTADCGTGSYPVHQAPQYEFNVGVAAPMAFFPFSGQEDSFFYREEVVVGRWPKEWRRKF
jgi:hypothetical protein